MESGNPLLLSSPEQNELQEESTKDNDLISNTWTESKKLWQIAGPSIFSRLSMFSMTLITQAFAGHLGDLSLTAISIVTTLGMASALETLCGQAYGAKQYHILGIYMQRSWIVLFISSILLIPLFVFASPFLKLIGQSATLADQTGIVPLHLSFPFQFTKGNTFTPFFLGLAGCVYRLMWRTFIFEIRLWKHLNMVKVTDDPVFTRDGADVCVHSNISFTQAILGGKVDVPTLSGNVQVKIPKGVQHGNLLVLRGKGLPKHGFLIDHGDQYVRFRINVPKPKRKTSGDGPENEKDDQDESRNNLQVCKGSRDIAPEQLKSAEVSPSELKDKETLVMGATFG